jgi:hypothetical protein
MASQAQPALGGASGPNPTVSSCSATTATGELSVYVCADAASRPPIAQVGVQPVNDETHGPLGAKQTDKNGHAVYPGIAPADYTVTVTLSGDNLTNYAWPSTDDAAISATNSVPPKGVTFYPFKAIPLARPKIQVLWQDDNDNPVSGVKVQLSATIALSDTGGDGIAQLADGTRGLRAASFNPAFTFPSKNVELMDGRQIAVAQGSTDTYPFHIRKCWVEFVVTDKFQNTLEEGDYVLTYPDGRPPENGSFTSGDNGKVHKDVPPGEYKFELKWHGTHMERFASGNRQADQAANQRHGIYCRGYHIRYLRRLLAYGSGPRFCNRNETRRWHRRGRVDAGHRQTGQSHERFRRFYCQRGQAKCDKPLDSDLLQAGF